MNRHFTRLSRLTTGAAVALAATLALTAGAGAAPRLVANGHNIEDAVIDGSNIYWTDGKQVTRTDAATGVGNVIFRHRGLGGIDQIRVGGGTLAILDDSRARPNTDSTSVTLYFAASGQSRVAAKAVARSRKGRLTCGTTLSLGNVTSAGEAVLIKGTFSLKPKICKKPSNVQFDVLASGQAGSRALFHGAYANGNPLLKLIDITSASLSGDRLLLVGFGAGTLDLASRQFVTVVPERKNVFPVGDFDQLGNLLLTAYRSGHSSISGSTNIYSAESGYTVSTPVETAQGLVFWAPCGAYLMRTKFALRKGQTTEIDVKPNPLKPDGLAASTPLPLSTQLLTTSSCDATDLVYVIPGASGDSIFVAPLAG